jgi:hypothetical protein
MADFQFVLDRDRALLRGSRVGERNACTFVQPANPLQVRGAGEAGGAPPSAPLVQSPD